MARRAERQIAPHRGELAAASLDLLRGAGDLSAFGAAGRALREVGEADRRVARGEARSAYAKGGGAAVALIAAGTAIWAALVLGVPAVRSGALAAVTLDLLAATEGRTCLLITHRPVDAAQVDQIVRLGVTGPDDLETTPRALVPTGPLTAAV